MKVYLRTFGCRANQYDSEAVRAMVESAGGEVVAAPELADFAVFNSCAVTADAEADLRQSVRRAARSRPTLRTVVMGCAAARDGGTLAALPSVHAVVPAADLDAVGEALSLDPAARHAAPTAQSGTRALMRIQDGCDAHCTFCATTLARGAGRSREARALVDEAAALAERHPEIVLTGIHIGHYGTDIGSSLSALVERLVGEVPRVRFRLTSLEATEVDDRLLALFAERERLAPHLHAPLQSGSDPVLKRMGRHWYTAATYARGVERFVAAATRGGSSFALGADLIVGFPGESEEDHLRTIALVRALPFTYLHVFPFSLRPGTAAERLGGQVSGATAGERARALRALGSELATRHQRRRVGEECDLVIVGSGARREGITEDYLTVRVSAAIPRGTRCRARLDGDPPQLLGIPLPPIIQE